ncbi:MAG: hypothetical protein ACREIQ_12640, partial [Nitrospiria bacterium]
MKLIGTILFAGSLTLLLSSCASTPRALTLTKVVQIDPAEQSAAATIPSGGDSDHANLAQSGEFAPLNPFQGQTQGPSSDRFNKSSQSEAVLPGSPIVEEIEESEDEVETGEEVTYDVPIIRNASVEAHIEYFQTVIKDRFELWLSRSGRYIPFMKETFKSYGLPEDLVFVALIESGFNPIAYSRARAVG